MFRVLIGITEDKRMWAIAHYRIEIKKIVGSDLANARSDNRQRNRVYTSIHFLYLLNVAVSHPRSRPMAE